MKILAAASKGGHWIELQRVVDTMSKQHDITYISTNKGYASMVEGHNFHLVKDFSQWNALMMIPVLLRSLKIVSAEKPNVVISTGAAPGLMVLLAAKMLGIRTIWIDSIASVTKLSLSGRLATKFATRVYTQWEELSTDKVLYKGNVLG